ncbi:MAG: DUF1573 domain-containing protein [Pontiellaceae bacterium]|nr:DUF1573 domain-containing protein [Pontiellaceae bacterium]MBN2783288.1 DUF1573 domain-containing protein [Pontiellaceae bacterium]
MMRWIIVFCFVALSAFADIEWKTREVELKVLPTQVLAEAQFVFTNAGPDTVSIDDVQISCGCLSVKSFRKSYAPGETGRLSVVYNLRNRTGRQSKMVRVVTSDGRASNLSVTADIPVLYDATPRLLMWKKSDESTEKVIKLSNPNKDPIKLLSATSSQEKVSVHLKEIRAGYEYEVIVTREPGSEKARSVIRVETEKPTGVKETKSIKLYVVIDAA